MTWDELRIAWRALKDAVVANRDSIPAGTLEAFGDAARSFLSAYEARSSLADVLDDGDLLRQWFETYYGWAGLMAKYVGRSPLPDAPVPRMYDAARAVDRAVDAGKAVLGAGGLVIGLGLLLAASKGKR